MTGSTISTSLINSLHGDLTPVTLNGGSHSDFVFPVPVDSITGYSVTLSGGNLNINSLLAPVPNRNKDIIIFNANLNNQNRVIRLLHNFSGGLPTSILLTPDRTTYFIREYESARLTWSVEHQRWLINGLRR